MDIIPYQSRSLVDNMTRGIYARPENRSRPPLCAIFILEIFFALTNRCVSQLVPYRFFHGIAGDILISSTQKTNSAGTEPGDPWMDQTYSGLARVLVGMLLHSRILATVEVGPHDASGRMILGDQWDVNNVFGYRATRQTVKVGPSQTSGLMLVVAIAAQSWRYVEEWMLR